MKAGDMTLGEVRRLAAGIEELNLTLSFIQVEEGLLELEACWDGFRDAANHFGQEFDDKRDCAVQFGLSVADFYEFSELVSR
jgi:hypothetical protein